jgi:hypothetical protein
MIHALLFAVQVFINGQAIEAVETNGALYVPVDAVAKALGATVTVQTNEPPPAAVVPPSAPPAEPTAEKPPAAEQPVTTTTVRLTMPALAKQAGSVQGQLKYKRDVFDLRGRDAGAEVWLVPARDVAALAAAAGGTDAEPIPPTADGWDKKLTEKFSFLHAVADHNGRYAITNVPPGEYTVVLLSRNAGGLAVRDNRGKMRFVKAHVREGLTTDVSFNFGVSTWFAEDQPAPKKAAP